MWETVFYNLHSVCCLLQDASNLYIFIELVTKGSLRNLYQRYNLRDSQVSAYTRQILHGLKYLHERNIVHRWPIYLFNLAFLCEIDHFWFFDNLRQQWCLWFLFTLHTRNFHLLSYNCYLSILWKWLLLYLCFLFLLLDFVVLGIHFFIFI